MLDVKAATFFSKMKNILSYPPTTLFLGKEIRDWIEYHANHETSHTKQAKYMLKRHENLKDECYYTVHHFVKMGHWDNRKQRGFAYIKRASLA